MEIGAKFCQSEQYALLDLSCGEYTNIHISYVEEFREAFDLSHLDQEKVGPKSLNQVVSCLMYCTGSSIGWFF